MEPAQTNTKKKIIAGLIVLVAIALIAMGTKALTEKDDAAQNTAQVSSSSDAKDGNNNTDTAASTPDARTPDARTGDGDGRAAADNGSAYKDGTYTATGNYTSPGGAQSVSVSITIKNDVVTSSDVQEKASDPESSEYQADFISGYKSFVTGKNIDTISLSRVSGSSLTSGGFNRAIERIKEQAKA